MLSEAEFAALAERVKDACLAQDDERWKEVAVELHEHHLCVRWRNASGCSDGCCSLDQLVLEEHVNRKNAYWAERFNDNAIQPVRSRVILTREEEEGEEGA